MLSLADKFSKDVDEVHKLFFQVSCDRERLVKYLQGDRSVHLWGELEDLALKEEYGQMYHHVLNARGDSEVEKRKAFLEIN